MQEYRFAKAGFRQLAFTCRVFDACSCSAAFIWEMRMPHTISTYCRIGIHHLVAPGERQLALANIYRANAVYRRCLHSPNIRHLPNAFAWRILNAPPNATRSLDKYLSMRYKYRERGNMRDTSLLLQFCTTVWPQLYCDKTRCVKVTNFILPKRIARYYIDNWHYVMMYRDHAIFILVRQIIG